VNASAAVANLSHLTPDDLTRLSVIALEGKFSRIRCVLACWTRGELEEPGEPGLAKALKVFETKNEETLEPPPPATRKLTVNGLPALEMPLMWREG
jgi:hypothetical protein